MSTEEENKLFAQRFYDDLYNRGRLALAEELVTANFADRTAAPGTLAGPAWLCAAVTQLKRNFLEYRYVIEDLIAEGDRVVALLTFSGTPLGGAEEAAPHRIEHAEIHVLRGVDGRGVECWTARNSPEAGAEGRNEKARTDQEGRECPWQPERLQRPGQRN